MMEGLHLRTLICCGNHLWLLTARAGWKRIRYQHLSEICWKCWIVLHGMKTGHMMLKAAWNMAANSLTVRINPLVLAAVVKYRASPEDGWRGGSDPAVPGRVGATSGAEPKRRQDRQQLQRPEPVPNSCLCLPPAVGRGRRRRRRRRVSEAGEPVGSVCTDALTRGWSERSLMRFF